MVDTFMAEWRFGKMAEHFAVGSLFQNAKSGLFVDQTIVGLRLNGLTKFALQWGWDQPF